METKEISKYITPTTKDPVFSAYCSVFGSIETNYYKDYMVNFCIGSTFATNYIDAVNNLHQWIKENRDFVIKNKASFELSLINGNIDKYGDILHTKIYKLSFKTIKSLILN